MHRRPYQRVHAGSKFPIAARDHGVCWLADRYTATTETPTASYARYLWAVPIARICEVLPNFLSFPLARHIGPG